MTEGPTNPYFSGKDVIQTHPVATLLVDRDQKIVDANAAAENLLNMARGAFVGLALLDVIDLPNIALSSVWESDGKSFSAYDISAQIGRAGERVLDILVSAAHGDTGFRLVALPLSGGPVSSTQRPGSGARAATAAAAMLAHEIKNPLSGIRGAAQLMEGATGADTTRFAQLVCAEVDRIAALIDAMQNFTRYEPYALSLENIYPAINQARDIAKAGFAHAVAIVEEYDPSLPEAMISHDGLVQVLLNLIKNAAEALVHTDAPIIRLSTAFRHGLSYDAGDGRGRIALPIEIAVCDNGPGVPPELVDDMFNPFVSGSALETGRGSGQGLGLAMVDKLIREMGGLVRYQRDTALGVSYFRVHLPVNGGSQ